MRKRVITLLTDFGTKDHYVASMKGIMLQINPRCTLVDITHQISPQNIEEGAFVLANAYASFPKGTIHLAVVDPGVGGPRKAILFMTDDYFFLGPDNGLLTIATGKERLQKAVILAEEDYFLPKISDTFHGRDLFAPVAGHLSLGVNPAKLGRKTNSWVELPFPKPIVKAGKLTGEIVYSDSFGNLISNIEEGQLSAFTRGRVFSCKIGRRSIKGLRKGYWQGKRNELIALIGSGGFLEIAVAEGSAQKKLGANKGDRIEVISKPV